MRFADLVLLYFQQSNALQTLWIVYILVIGGLLAVSALRRDPDFIGGVLATVLFLAFAHKNLGAIQDTSNIRHATLQAIRQYDVVALAPSESAGFKGFQQQVIPTLYTPDIDRIGHFHHTCDAITITTLWALQWRRLRTKRAALTR
ncbi:hypothetical protein BH10PLA1_BH10PLA1_12630 [soil metagenome]